MFIISIIIASLGVLPLPIAFAAAAICVVIFGIVPLHELYESIDWPIIVLLAAMIPLGTALESTGATALLVSNIAVLGKTTGPVFMLVIILIITMTLSDVMGENGTIVFFTCNHCPYVVGSEPRIERIAEISRSSGIGFAGINSNDPVKYESDSWGNMVKRASKGMSYAYLHDSSQEIALSYGAERTPEFYLINSRQEVIYRGRMDDSPRDPSHATTSELEDAINSLVSGQEISIARTESIGCSVKWKA